MIILEMMRMTYGCLSQLLLMLMLLRKPRLYLYRPPHQSAHDSLPSTIHRLQFLMMLLLINRRRHLTILRVHFIKLILLRHSKFYIMTLFHKHSILSTKHNYVCFLLLVNTDLCLFHFQLQQRFFRWRWRRELCLQQWWWHRRRWQPREWGLGSIWVHTQ